MLFYKDKMFQKCNFIKIKCLKYVMLTKCYVLKMLFFKNEILAKSNVYKREFK